jgi:signal transduction histidine kinase
MLDDIGLLATLQWHWKKFQDRRPKFRLSMKLAAAETDIPPKLKLVIYRIVQEASVNDVSIYPVHSLHILDYGIRLIR